MRLTNVPPFTAVVSHFAEWIKLHETTVPPAMAVNVVKPEKFVGIASVTTEDQADKISVPIYLADQYFALARPCEQSSLPYASIAKLVDGTFSIYVNTTTRELCLNQVTEAVVIGMLAHELGHLLAGHHSRAFDAGDVYEYEPRDYETIARNRLNGRACGHPDELEADEIAIGLVGFGPVIASLAMQSARSHNIGVQMEFSNRLYHFIDQMQADYQPFLTQYINFTFAMFDDDELAEAQTSATDEPT